MISVPALNEQIDIISTGIEEIIVLEELDNCKKRPNGVGVNARSIIRTLDDLREKGKLHEKIEIENEQTISLAFTDQLRLFDNLAHSGLNNYKNDLLLSILNIPFLM